MQLAQLKKQDLDYEKAAAVKCKRSLRFFVEEFWDLVIDNPLVWNWHMSVLCFLIERVDKRVFLRLAKLYDVIINIPPGTSKTMICCVMATAWDFANMPSIRVFVGSFSDDVVTDISDKIGTIMSSEKYRRYFPGTQIRKDVNNAHQFKTTKNGHFKAFTVKGGITGTHADILRIDDPLNPKMAASKAEILYVNKIFFDKTLPSRKVDKTVTPTYLIMQRLATNDPTAHLLERAQKGGAEIYHLCLPARVSDLVTPAEHKDQYQDGYLDIKRLGEDALSELEASLGPSEASGQLAQNPVPEGGTIIKRDWFEVIDPLDLPREVLEQQTNIFEDTALTKNKNNDPSGILCATMHQNIIYLTYYWHGWLELHDLVEKNREIALAWGDEDTLICVENKANGADVINEMNRIYYNEFNVIGINETASKEVRLKNWASKIRAGKVKLVKGSWNTHFLDEVSGFGAVPHDESVDCLTMCCKYYSGGYDEGRQTESF